MIVPIETLRTWMTRCQTNESLHPYDPRYVNLETLEIDGEPAGLRGGDWIEPLSRCIRLAEKPTCQLFSGYTGTGKSTELLRLRKHLTDKGYTVLLADAVEYHDLEHPLRAEDLMIIVAAAFGDCCAELLGEDPEKVGYWQRFGDLMRSEIGASEMKLPVKPLDIKLTVRNGTSPVWSRIRNHLATSPGRLRKHAHDFISKYIARLLEQQEGEVVFIFDSLEKLSGPDYEFLATMQSVVQVFTQHSGFLRLPNCHTVYTISPYASLVAANITALYDRAITRPLPAVKVSEKDGSAYAKGVSALRTLVGKRLPLEEAFADRLDLLDKLILSSGGHIRTLISMIREVLMANIDSPFPPTPELIDSVITFFSEDATQAVRPEGVLLLDSIRQTHSLKKIPSDQLALLARYVDHHLVLCYQNGGGWYEIHPLIREDIRIRAEEQRAEAGQ